HAVMAKEGILPTLDDMFGPGGRQLLAQMPFEGAYALRVASLLELLDHYRGELTVIEAKLAARLAGHQGDRRAARATRSPSSAVRLKDLADRHRER
ncbi:MAG: IS110 family transposase, partial [Acidimicrobiales bacterium]